MAIIIETANSTTERLTGWIPRRFTWGLIRKGDCTMFEGAKWTLCPDGTATFDATVTGCADHHAWVIWHVDLLDHDGAVLGSLTTEHPVEGDRRKFVRHMPSGAERYRFRAWATFAEHLLPDLAALKMHSSC
jgi:hypothetical protein